MPGDCMDVCNVMLIANYDHPNLRGQTRFPLMIWLHNSCTGICFIHLQKKKKDMIIAMAPGQMAMSKLNHSGYKLLSML